MAVNPENAGTTAPAAGSYPVENNSSTAISATPAVGYLFDKWLSNGGATVLNPNSASTTVTMTGDGSVIANFANAPRGVLAVSANPAAGGTTAPEAGAHSILLNHAESITATPAKGYAFVNWTAVANAVFADANSAETSVTITDNAQITANFAEIAVLTMASNPLTGLF